MADSYNFFHKDLIMHVIKLSFFTGFTYFALTWLLSSIGPKNSIQKKTAKAKAKKKLEMLDKKKLKLDEYEVLIASNLVIPDEIDVSWKDIAGLDEIIFEIMETVIYPIVQQKSLSNSKLSKPPKGVLLHGPPGCGKTLIAKATAKQAAANFINLDVSMLTDKWYGESQKLVGAVFSLANKLSPCIIFIDEIDSVLRTRNSTDHEATAMMKSQFLQTWDGLNTEPDNIVVVMGATNRPHDIDKAIMRRMPASFKIPLPNYGQRRKIVELIMASEITEGLDYDYIASKTDGYSGSDLKEVCRIASLYRIREHFRKANELFGNDLELGTLRAINMKDMERALKNLGIQG